MSNTLPVPPSPEAQKNEALELVVRRAEELLDGVNSEVEDFSVPALGMPGEDMPEDATESFTSAHRSVSFEVTSPDGQVGKLAVDQVTQQDTLITEVMTVFPNTTLSVAGKNVVDVRKYIIDKNPDGSTAHVLYTESQNVLDNDGKVIMPDYDQDEPISLDDPEWAYKMLERMRADEDMESLKPKLDVPKLQEVLKLMDTVDPAARTVEIGTEDVGPEGLDELDIRDDA